jgi:hypothetical protein
MPPEGRGVSGPSDPVALVAGVDCKRRHDFLQRHPTDLLPPGRDREVRTMEAGGERFDWSLLVPRTIHELKVAIIEALEWIGQPLAPSELLHVIDESDNENFSLSHLSYHMTKLEKMGALKVVRKEQVRGAMKKYYWFT